ncbi:hypothetical protein AAHA92_29071 [Salvia divinorum]|uniref:Ty3 transposon capsid-like protein domain-containing protein n=1 Tax=Salvia divinorum TaxID=28513 RepID=A0ABD1FX57_SALDI
MQSPSPISSSSTSNDSLCIGTIPVTVPTIGDPNFVPSGIKLSDPMVETRSGDNRRFEEMLTAAMAALIAKMSDAERRRDESESARDRTLQQTEIMTRFMATGGGFPVRPPQYFATRQSKVGFPVFSGEDLAGWLLRCDHFFTVDLTPEDSKVRLAVINFEGRALQWFQNWTKYHLPMATPWRVFIQALEGRFGDHLLGDPISELLALKQTGTFAEYHDRFELLLGRVSISESYAISHFINGLRPFIQKTVRLFMPQTLVHAYALARLQDLSAPAREGFSQGSKKFYSGGSTAESRDPSSGPTSTPLLPTPITPTFKNRKVLSQEEMNERRAKGLCFGCNEKFDRNHHCVRKQLFILEVDDGDRRVEVVQEGVKDDDCG